MSISSIGQATNTINAGIGTLAQNFDSFLSLLTTQLKNQDPLSPLDNNEFTQQLTAMTGVQQQLLTNQLLTQLLGENQASLGASAINMIGKTVTVISDEQVLQEDGATWTYKLDAAAAQTKLEVVNSSNQVVWTGFAETNAKGENTFEWDGTSLAGATMPVGQTYSLRITAVDGAGAQIAATPLVTGLATRLETIGGQTVLTVGGVKALLTDLTAVEIAPS